MHLSETLSKVVRRAMQIREDSYDKEASANASKASTAAWVHHQATTPEKPFYDFVDYTKFYKLTLQQSAFQAASEFNDPTLWFPTYLLMNSDWNDIEMWANDPRAFENLDNPPSNDIDAPLPNPEG